MRPSSAVAIARQSVAGELDTVGPSSRSRARRARGTIRFHAGRTRATVSAVVRVIPSATACDRAHRVRTHRAETRATMPRRMIFSAPGRCADARCDLPARERLYERQRSLAASSSARTTPSSVRSSSARMKLPKRCEPPARLAPVSAYIVHVAPRTVSLVSSWG